MARQRLIAPVVALVMALGLIGIGGSVPIMGSENTTSAATSCYTLNQLDRTFGIVISEGDKHGLLFNDKHQVAGAVLWLDRSGKHLLRSKGWIIQGSNPSVKSAWAPNKCIALRSGGWKPSVTVSRTCMTLAVVDSRFGIVRDAGGTTNGLIISHGKIVGAVVHLDTPEKRSILERKHWAWNGENPTIKSIFAPQWCIPLKSG